MFMRLYELIYLFQLGFDVYFFDLWRRRHNSGRGRRFLALSLTLTLLRQNLELLATFLSASRISIDYKCLCNTHWVQSVSRSFFMSLLASIYADESPTLSV